MNLNRGIRSWSHLDPLIIVLVIATLAVIGSTAIIDFMNQAQQETETEVPSNILMEPGMEYSIPELLSHQEKGTPLFLSPAGSIPLIYIRFYEGRIAETGVVVVGYDDIAEKVEIEISLYNKGEIIFQDTTNSNTYGMEISIPASVFAEAETISFHAN